MSRAPEPADSFSTALGLQLPTIADQPAKNIPLGLDVSECASRNIANAIVAETLHAIFPGRYMQAKSKVSMPVAAILR